jgi:hypothetical protein
MLRRGALPLLVILLFGSFLSIPFSFPQAHGLLTGEVCLGDPSTANASSPCSSSPPVFDGPLGQQIRIGVYINASDTMNVFEVTLLADHTVLKPVGVDLTNSVLAVGGPAVLVGECLQGILIAGGACINNDTIDTLSIAAGAPVGNSASAPATGLLFTAIYDITGTSASGGTSIRYNPGCGTTSLTGGLCVTIANGPNIDPETSQAATFNNFNSATMPDVVLSANPSSFGPGFPGASSANITASAMNSYPSTATDGVTFTTSSSATSVTASISGTNPCLTTGTSCNVTLTVVTTAAGNYQVTVFGTYATVDQSGNPDTLVSSVTVSVVVDDFSITVNPTTVKFSGGATGTATVTLSSVDGFAGTVSLSTGTVIPPGLTITYSPNPVTLTASGAGSTQSVTATFSANPSSSTTYHTTIRATSGSRVKASVQLTVIVSTSPDFTVTASPTSVPASVGVAATSTITVTALHGFTGTVTLTNTTSSPSLSCKLSPSTITASGTSTLTCTGSSAGTFTANVTGTSGTLVHSVLVSFVVTFPSPDFTVSAKPISATVKAGANATSTISVNATNGLTGTINLADKISGGSGLLCTLSPTSVTLGNSGTSTLSCTGSAGSYTVTVTGSNATNSHSTTFTVTVQDFTLTANPSSFNVNATATGTSIITVTPEQSFSDTVNLALLLSPLTGLSCLLSTSTISGGSGISTLTCNGVAGNYAVNITGTDGSLSHSTLVHVMVEDFGITANPLSISFNTNGSAKTNITITPEFGFAAMVALSAKASDPSITWGFSTNTVTGGSGISTLTVTGSANGIFTLNVTGVSGPLTHTVTITVQVSAGPDYALSANPSNVAVNLGTNATSTITVTAISGLTGTITLTNSSSSPALKCSLSQTKITLGSSGSSILSCKGSVGAYTVTVSGRNGTTIRSVNVSVTVQDFTISSNPSTVTVNAGANGTSVITVSPVQGFSGGVGLSFITNSSSLSCSLSSAVIPGGGGTSTLYCKSSGAGNFVATVTGVNGTLTHSTMVTFHVQDFNITASQPGSVDAGVAATSTITIFPVNGFTGTVTLSASTNSTSLVCTFSSSTVSGGSGTSTMYCSSTKAGNYTATVTGTNGSLSQSASQILVSVSDFSITGNPSTIAPVLVGINGTSTISITSLNGFTGTVTLSKTSPSEVTSSLNATSVTGHGSVRLTITGTVDGNYNVNVTATSGSLSHIVTINLVVTDFSPVWSSTTINLSENTTSSVQLSVSSLNGFAGNVGLSYVPVAAVGSITTALLNATFANPTLSIVANGQSSTQVTVGAAHNLPSGFYGINVTVTSSSHSVSRVLIVQVPPSTFSLVVARSTTTGPGVTGSSTITIAPSGGLTGFVSLSVSSPSPALTCSLSLANVGPVQTGSNTTVLSCKGSPGSYNVTIAGVGTTPFPSQITRMAYTEYVVSDFTLTPFNTGITVVAGQTGHAQIKISWTNNYDGTVSLTASLPSGLNATLSPATLTGAGNVTLNVFSVSAGTYTVTINASSGPDSHSTTVTVIVTPLATEATIFGLDPALFYSLVGIGIVAVAGGAWLFLRSRKRVQRPKR